MYEAKGGHKVYFSSTFQIVLLTCTHVSSIKTLMKVGCYKVLITLFTKGYFNFNKVLFSMFNRKAKYLKSL